MTLGLCWGHFGHMEVLLGHFGPLWGYSGAALSSLWGGSLLAYEGGFRKFWGRFGVTLSSLWAYSSHMKMTLDWLSYRPWCIKVNFQKILVFPMNFNDFTHFSQ